MSTTTTTEPVVTAPVAPNSVAQRVSSGVSAGLLTVAWLCALAMPLVGLGLGLHIMGRQKGTTESAGKWIVGVSIAVMVFGVAIALASAGSSDSSTYTSY